MERKPELGSTQRYRSLENELAKRGGAKNPDELGAAIGRRKMPKPSPPAARSKFKGLGS